MDKKISQNINLLKEKDLYSIFLYAIYKNTQDPQYSTLSELIYTLDKKNLLNLCSVFGGCTIKIPTIDELKLYSSGLLVYDLISRGNTFTEAFKETGLPEKYKLEVAKIYKVIEKIVSEYGK